MGSSALSIAAGLFCLPAVYILRRLALSNLVRPMPAVMLALGAACCAAFLKSQASLSLDPRGAAIRGMVSVRLMLATFGVLLTVQRRAPADSYRSGAVPAVLLEVCGCSATRRFARSLALLLLAGTDLLRGFERVLYHKTYAAGGVLAAPTCISGRTERAPFHQIRSWRKSNAEMPEAHPVRPQRWGAMMIASPSGKSRFTW